MTAMTCPHHRTTRKMYLTAFCKDCGTKLATGTPNVRLMLELLSDVETGPTCEGAVLSTNWRAWPRMRNVVAPAGVEPATSSV